MGPYDLCFPKCNACLRKGLGLEERWGEGTQGIETDVRMVLYSLQNLFIRNLIYIMVVIVAPPHQG